MASTRTAPETADRSGTLAKAAPQESDLGRFCHFSQSFMGPQLVSSFLPQSLTGSLPVREAFSS